MNLLRAFALLVASSLLTQSADLAAAARPITPQDLWAFRRLGSPRVSPDGRWLAFTVQTFSIEEDKGRTHLWVHDTARGATRQMTFAKANDGSPAWSPDSRSLAFVRRVEGEPAALFVLPLDGGEPRPVLDLAFDIEQPRWLADGRRIVFATRVLPALAGDDAATRQEIKRRKESKMSGKVTENRLYRFWDTWQTDGHANRLMTVDVETRQVTDLTPGFDRLFSLSGEVDFDVSPDGSVIALAINATPPPYRDDPNNDIFLVPTDGSGPLRNLTADSAGDDSHPRFSPDGRTVLFGHRNDPTWSGENRKLFRLDPVSGARTRLAPELDLSFDDYDYSPDGSAIWFVAEDRGIVPVFRMRADGTDAAPVTRAGTALEIAVGADRVYALADTASRPAEIQAIDATTPAAPPTWLTHVNDDVLAGLELGRVEAHTFKGAAGDDVQVWVTLPPGFDPAQRYPLVQLLHGGPQTMVRDSFSYRWNAHLFAAAGYVVAWVNRHGSTGFGEKFAQSINGEWGLKPTEDVLRGTDFLLAKYPNIDPERIAAAGASYGGYLATWLLGHTDRFRCYVVHAGVTEFTTQFGGDITYSWTRVLGGTPWEGRDEMLANSPLHFAANFKAPTLVVHGEMDYRVPVGQGLALYGILQAKGVPSRLLYFPNENHWILKPQNSIQWNVEVRNWLVRHLGGTPLEMPVFESAPAAGT